MSHTPGPWAFRRFGGAIVLVADYGLRKVVLGAGRNFVGVPTLLQGDGDGVLVEFDPKSHDGRLIEAAPEMLSLISGYIDDLCGCEEVSGDRGKVSYQCDWCKVLSKATGGSENG